MNAKQIAANLGMSPQEEGGLVKENHYSYEGSERAPSGQAYYYFKPEVDTVFHILDCDEYWVYHAGSDIEVWVIAPDGSLEIRRLGISDGAELCLYFKKGVAFAAKPTDPDADGTVTTLITVPRFSEKGLRLLDQDEVIRLCPEAKTFFEPNKQAQEQTAENRKPIVL